jgi:hypothetical protein
MSNDFKVEDRFLFWHANFSGPNLSPTKAEPKEEAQYTVGYLNLHVKRGLTMSINCEFVSQPH